MLSCVVLERWGGRRQGAKPLRFAAPPQGEQGVIESGHQAAESAVTWGLSHAADPSKLEAKMHHFSSLDFGPLFFKPNLQNLRKLAPKETTFGGPNRLVCGKNAVRTASPKKSFKKLPKMMPK